MILVTGGLGFIGAHTARALLDSGRRCVVTRHHATEVPEFLRADLGEGLIVEPLDLEDLGALLRIGQRHEITGVVHLADTAAQRLWKQPGDPSPRRLQGLFEGLGNVLQAASEWGVARVTMASSIGVYGGLPEGLWMEEMPLLPAAFHAIPTAKRCSELLASFVAGQEGLDLITVRPSAIWGPGGRASSSFFALPGLVHAAVRGARKAPTTVEPVYAQDGGDLCYVKDCARAIALIQTAGRLHHGTYNVGGGRVTTNAEIVAAIRHQVPGVSFDLAGGRNPRAAPTDPCLDLTRIHEDTGYQPAYGIERGVADYVAWLRADHER
ncbi:MAG: NAD-dependent epimerase/dehydratase family protein [Candidatus Dormibacteraceae bacterium]